MLSAIFYSREVGQFLAIGHISQESNWANSILSAIFYLKEVGQFLAIDPISQESNWANSMPSAALLLRNSGPLRGHRQHLAVGQLDAIGNILFKGSWPIPCHRPYLSGK
jgi:hypothetical protein